MAKSLEPGKTWQEREAQRIQFEKERRERDRKQAEHAKALWHELRHG